MMAKGDAGAQQNLPQPQQGAGNVAQSPWANFKGMAGNMANNMGTIGNNMAIGSGDNMGAGNPQNPQQAMGRVTAGPVMRSIMPPAMTQFGMLSNQMGAGQGPTGVMAPSGLQNLLQMFGRMGGAVRKPF